MSSPNKPRRRFISVFVLLLIGLFSLLSSIATNIATNIIPEQYNKYLWFSWPALGVLFIGISILTIWQYYRERSGKSIALLIIIANLLEKARIDKSSALPIVLNLASWNKTYDNFYLWLIAELQIRYQIPLDFGKHLIHSNSITLLLDGLDRVSQYFRQDCVN